MRRIAIVAVLAWLPPASAGAYSFLECMELGVPRQTCVDAVIGLPPNSEDARKAVDAVVVDYLRATSWPYGALPDHL